MRLERWLKENDSRVDWSLFSSPWDEMQLRHNPFRHEQIEAIVSSSGILGKASPVVLDLGCGPGALGRLIAHHKPLAHYVGVDGDPLMLAAMEHLVRGKHVRALLLDLRESGWSREYSGQCDSVVSLTALHWLSREHQKNAYAAAFEALKPGGTFVVGDPYQPEDPAERAELQALHDERASTQAGQTWEEFWDSFFEGYPIRQMYTEYHALQRYQIPFEGSDDGYPLSFHKEALEDVGFRAVSVFWKADLRVVYGGTK